MCFYSNSRSIRVFQGDNFFITDAKALGAVEPQYVFFFKSFTVESDPSSDLLSFPIVDIHEIAMIAVHAGSSF